MSNASRRMRFKQVWLAFKLLLSATLVGAPVALLIFAPHAIADSVFIGVTALMLFLAALPWLDFTAPNRGLALVCIAFALGAVLLAGRTALSVVPFPRACAGRGAGWCDFENLLFAAGGAPLAAAPQALLAALVLAGSIRMFAPMRRKRFPPCI